MSTRVGFDATPAIRQSAGIGRYTRELLGALASRSDDLEYRLYSAGGVTAGSLPGLDRRFSYRTLPVSDRVLNLMWHRLRLPFPVQLITGRIDLFHSPDFTLPPSGRVPTVLTIHDLAFLRVPECAYPTLRAYLQEVVPRSVRRATNIIAVSESTRGDLMELLEVPAERITVVPEGVSPSFHPIAAEEAYRIARSAGIQEPFILSVGTLEPRKNYVRLLRAYAALRSRGIRERLVIAGRRGWLFQPIFDTVRDLHLDEHVTFLAPSDDQLPGLYSAAQLFVYPSLYEGFGIPALEALACGCPSAVSRSSSLPEVVGNAAVMFSPTNLEEMIEVMWSLMGNKALRTELSKAGPVQASAFTWPRTASETVALYHGVTHA